MSYVFDEQISFILYNESQRKINISAYINQRRFYSLFARRLLGHVSENARLKTIPFLFQTIFMSTIIIRRLPIVETLLIYRSLNPL